MTFGGGHALAAAKPAKLAPVPPPAPAAALDQPASVSLNAAPAISGTASSTTLVHLRLVDAGGAIAFEGDLPVAGGHWLLQTPILHAGQYRISVANAPGRLVTPLLASGLITIGLRASPQVTPDFLPAYDVADGKLMRFTVEAVGGPVALNKFTFVFEETSATLDSVSLYAFSDGAYSTPADASSTDGLVAGDSPGDGPLALKPAAPIVVPAAQTYYFELDGSVTPTDSQYSVSTTLLGDRSQAAPGTADALASSSNFVWSPDTYGTSSTTDPDWFNGSLVSGLPQDGLMQGRSGLPPPPSCILSANATSTAANQPVVLTWTTADAEYATWESGASAPLQGSAVVQSAGAHTYVLTVHGSGATDTCTATVLLPQVITPPATTTPPVADSLAAVPTTGSVSLAVTFSGTVNNAKSCAAITYYLGYGDNSTSTIVVAKNVCKAQSFSLAHTYTKTGTFVAALYNGPGTTTAQLIQKQTILVKAKVAIINTLNNMASVVESVGRVLTGWLKNLANLLRW